MAEENFEDKFNILDMMTAINMAPIGEIVKGLGKEEYPLPVMEKVYYAQCSALSMLKYSYKSIITQVNLLRNTPENTMFKLTGSSLMAIVEAMHDFLHRQGYLVKTWEEIEHENIRRAIEDGQLDAAIEERLSTLSVSDDVKAKIRTSLKESIMRALDESSSSVSKTDEDWPDLVDYGKDSK